MITETVTQTRPAEAAPGDLDALVRSFRRSLLATNRSPRTVQSYIEGMTQFGDFLARKGMPLFVAGITREHVEEFIADLLSRHAAATARNRYGSLRAFFKWAQEEGEISSNPMVHVKPPKVGEQRTEVLTDDQLKRLLKACEGTGFAERRDTAILRLLFDTGMRRAELAGIKLADLDLDQSVVFVTGKGRRPRVVPFGRKTAQALDRYLRARASHRGAHAEALWLGNGGQTGSPVLTGDGVYQIVQRRGRQAGVALKPHALRHLFADRWLRAGGTENALMRLAGWRSRTMIDRYGAAVADSRARDAYRNLSPGDRL